MQTDVETFKQLAVHVKVNVHGQCVRVQTLNKQKFSNQMQELIVAANVLEPRR